MSDCCSSAPGFPSASQMEQLALDHPTIWREICAIQQAILSAASNCQPDGGRMCTVIGGDTPMTSVSGVRAINVIDPGSGYLIDHPAIEFIPPVGATATPASATIATNGGVITSVTVTAPGSGYTPVRSSLTISSASGIGANVLPLVNASGEIIGADIVDGGLGYTTDDAILATRAVAPNAAYRDARLRIASVSSSGRITRIDVIDTGTGYQPSVTTVRLVSSLSNGVAYPYGMGFDAVVQTDTAGGIVQVSVVNGGTGYVDILPRLVVSDIGVGLNTKVNVVNGTISTIDVVNRGANYTGGAAASVLNPVTTNTPPTRPAIVQLDVSVNIFGTNPQRYYDVLIGALTDKQIQTQMATVTSYFTRLGYSIMALGNPSTGNTIQWKVCW